MAKYLFKVKYTIPGVQGLLKQGGSARKAMAGRAIESVGGTVESFYFAFGSADVYLIADMPDAAAAAAASLNVSAGGGATAETVVLLTPEEIDRAAQLQVDYQPPQTQG